jgi:tRNA 5-methylaminomethyl-2-thiouridine biosynthesis bifunctional protein
VKTEPIVAAQVDFTAGAVRSPAFDDIYHPREGAFEQARDVFLAGNGLPGRWRGRAQFTILETGFGLGTNFLAAWAAWRDDPQRCDRLHFISLEKHPLTSADLRRAHAASPLPALAAQLVDAWPPFTPNLHCLDFDGGRVRLLLGLGDAATLARSLVAQVDAFLLDGFAPARNPQMWSERLFTALARLAAPGATAATWSAARVVRDGLQRAGFTVEAARGVGAKRDITLARYAPRFTPPRPPGRCWVTTAPSSAIVIGGGLAGASTARALRQQGVACTLFDRHHHPASEASGNPAGLFHGTVGTDDTAYTRLYRAASLAAARWVGEHPGCGQGDGLLRLDATRELASMRALLLAQRLPAAYVQALDAAQASALAGVALALPAWHYGAGGWADPSALVRATLAQAGVVWRGGVDVQRIEPAGDGWRVIDAHGRVQGEAPLIVLANAHDALRLAGWQAPGLRTTRGQVTWFDALAPRPRLPIASGGYLLALADGRLLAGATQQHDDADAAVRAQDHAVNLEHVRRLVGVDLTRAGLLLHGRVGWRLATHDRLPLAGALPDFDVPWPARRDAPRFVPRRAGCFIHAALGSRGLTTAALCGELIAAQATGAPWPLEADLADAVDPARLALRQS